MRKPYCIVNNELLALSDAKISVLDLGLTRSYGVFEFIRTYNNVPILIDEHLDRLVQSANIIGLNPNTTKKNLRTKIKELLEKNSFPSESTFKIILTGGESHDGVMYNNKNTNLIIIHQPFYPDVSIYTSGVNVLTFNYQRENPEAKTLNYQKYISTQSIREKNKAFNIIYYKNNVITEAATWNLFIVKNKVIYTPKYNILYGTVRKVIIELAKKKFEVKEKAIKLNDLFTADEVFLTGTSLGVVPVIQIDNRDISNKYIGRISKYLIKEYIKFMKNYSEKNSII